MPQLTFTNEQYRDLVIALDVATERYDTLAEDLGDDGRRGLADRLDALEREVLAVATAFSADDLVMEEGGEPYLNDELADWLEDEAELYDEIAFRDLLAARLAKRELAGKHPPAAREKMADEQWKKELDEAYERYWQMIEQKGIGFLEVKE